jgi:DNA-binding ferritin-like protein
MISESCLVDLINERFDDMKSQISELKADMLRESKNLKDQAEVHENDDRFRFDQISQKMQAFEKIKWTVMGAASAAFVVVQAAVKTLEHFSK